MDINPDTLEIEVVDVEAIDGGVQVFARAWNDGQQIGFGADGTVDIERFRIINPPILVADDAGDIVIEQAADEELGIPGYFQRFREDPAAAVIQSIEQTIIVMKAKVLASEAIIVGKRGNTTSTFYPDAGTGATTVDGQVNDNNAGSASTWGTFRDGGGDSAFPTNNPIVAAYHRSDATQYNLMIRSFYSFDTSTIPDADVISSATLSLYCTAVSSTSAFGGLSLGVATWTLTANNNLAAADYNITRIGSQVTTSKAFSTYTTSAYNDHTFTNLAAINKTGVTALASLTTAEITNTAPSFTASTTSSITVSAADNAGTSQDPMLVVEHAAASSPGSIFSFF